MMIRTGILILSLVIAAASASSGKNAFNDRRRMLADNECQCSDRDVYKKKEGKHIRTLSWFPDNHFAVIFDVSYRKGPTLLDPLEPTLKVEVGRANKSPHPLGKKIGMTLILDGEETHLSTTMTDRYPPTFGNHAEAVLIETPLTPELIEKFKAAQQISFVLDVEPRELPAAFAPKLHAFLDEYQARK